MGIRRACSARSGHGLLSINRAGKSAGPNQSEVAARRAATNAPENPTKTGPPKIKVIVKLFYDLLKQFEGAEAGLAANRAAGAFELEFAADGICLRRNGNKYSAYWFCGSAASRPGNAGYGYSIVGFTQVADISG